MSDDQVPYELSDDEAKQFEEAFLEEVPDGSIELKAFPPPGRGFSHCHDRKCYVSCGSKWLRLVNSSGVHLSCGGQYSFKCGNTKYRATRCR